MKALCQKDSSSYTTFLHLGYNCCQKHFVYSGDLQIGFKLFFLYVKKYYEHFSFANTIFFDDDELWDNTSFVYTAVSYFQEQISHFVLVFICNSLFYSKLYKQESSDLKDKFIVFSNKHFLNEGFYRSTSTNCSMTYYIANFSWFVSSILLVSAL